MNEIIKYYGYMDAILEYLSKFDTPPPFTSPNDLAKGAGLNIDHNTAHFSCAKMFRDGYLQKSSNGVAYTLLAEGLFFIKTGGYTVQINNEISKRDRLDKLERNNMVTQKRLFWLTVLVAVSTFFQALYSVVKLYWEHGWFRF